MTAAMDQDKPRIIESHGVKVTISPKILNNWHMVDLLADIEDNPTPSTMVRFLRLLLGTDQYRRVVDELTLEDGSLPAERMTEFLQDVMTGLDPKS